MLRGVLGVRIEEPRGFELSGSRPVVTHPLILAPRFNVDLERVIRVPTVRRVKVRIAQLTSPAFVGFVAVLALNDHVLKGRGPGVVTGKLSDFAGLFVVAALLGVLTRSRVFAIVSAAIGFVVLKTIPVVAVAAEPLLGGRTRVDVSDLVALLVLGPAWWWLGREHDARRYELRVALGVVSGLVAMLTVTATSCALHDQVEHLVRRPNGALVAAVRDNYELHGAVSRDGRRWEPARAAGRVVRRPPIGMFADRTCFRVVLGTRSSHAHPTETGAPHTDIPGRGGGIARDARVRFRPSRRSPSPARAATNTWSS